MTNGFLNQVMQYLDHTLTEFQINKQYIFYYMYIPNIAWDILILKPHPLLS